MSTPSDKTKQSNKNSRSADYRRQREKNNEQVRKCREKKQQKEESIVQAVHENEKKIKKLENAILNLSNELVSDRIKEENRATAPKEKSSSHTKKDWHGDPF